MTRKWRTASQQLADLEASDPAVKAAAESYDRMVDRLTHPDDYADLTRWDTDDDASHDPPTRH